MSDNGPGAEPPGRHLRVLQVVPYYAPAWGFGGPPRVMTEEARALVGLGHSVDVFTTDALERDRRMTGPSPSFEGGVAVHRFRNLSNRLAFDHYRFSPVGMRSALRQVACDVVHLSEVRHELAVLAWREVRRRDLPLVISAHGTLARGRGAKARIKGLYDDRLVDPMVRAAVALLAQTAHERDRYLAVGAPDDRVHLLPLGTDEPPDGRPADLGIDGDRRVVLFLGRLHPLKGVDRLIRAFAGVAGRHPDAVLVVAGRDDGAEADLQRLAADLGLGERVRFPGPVYGNDRFALYRRADLFAITPVHFEETSLASIEAASVGTPLLLGDEAEAPFLDEFRAGWRVAPGADVAPVLDEALRADLATAGAAAAAMATQRHLWPVVGAQLESILLGAVP